MTANAVSRFVFEVLAGAAVALLPLSAIGQRDPTTDTRNDHLEPLTTAYAKTSENGPVSPEAGRIAGELWAKLFVVYGSVADVVYRGTNSSAKNEWVISIHATEHTHGNPGEIQRDYSDYVVTCTVLDPGILSTEKMARGPKPGGFYFDYDQAKLNAIQVIRHDVAIPKDTAEAVRSAWLQAVQRARYRLEPINIMDGYTLTYTAFDPVLYRRMSGVALAASGPGLEMLEQVANKLFDYCSIPEGDRNAAAEEIRREANRAAAYIKEHDPFKP